MKWDESRPRCHNLATSMVSATTMHSCLESTNSLELLFFGILLPVGAIFARTPLGLCTGLMLGRTSWTKKHCVVETRGHDFWVGNLELSLLLCSVTKMRSLFHPWQYFCHLPTMPTWTISLNCNAALHQYPQLALGLAAAHPNLVISDADVMQMCCSCFWSQCLWMLCCDLSTGSALPGDLPSSPAWRDIDLPSFS